MVEQGMDIKIIKGAIIVASEEGICFYKETRRPKDELTPDILIYLCILEELLGLQCSCFQESYRRWEPEMTKRYDTFDSLQESLKSGNFLYLGVDEDDDQYMKDKVRNEMPSIISGMVTKGLINIYNKCHV
jgi:hypothetical protein